MRQLLLLLGMVYIIISCSSAKSKLVGSLQFGSEYTYIIGTDTVKKLVRNDSITQTQIQKLLATKPLIKTGRKGIFYLKAEQPDSIYIIKHKGTIAAYQFRPLTRYEKGHFYSEPCKKYIECKEGYSELYIVIGKQKYYEETPDRYCDRIILAAEYDIEYEVLEVLQGNFTEKTIAFKAIAEGGVGIEGDTHSLLLIGNYCGYLRLLYGATAPLYKTTDREWASPVNGYRYNYQLKNKNKIIQPVPVEFKEPLIFPLRNMSIEEIVEAYPAPFYEIKDSTAIARYGYYLPELLELYTPATKE